MSNLKAVPSPSPWAPLLLTCIMWVQGIFWVAGYYRQPITTAAACSAVAALGGLASWTAYHLTSRRNDGLAAFLLCFLPLTSRSTWDRPSPLGTNLARLAFLMAFYVVFHAAAGLGVRWWMARKARPEAPALWDAELDVPPPSKG